MYLEIFRVCKALRQGGHVNKPGLVLIADAFEAVLP
jgi:hypothetical protein